MLLFLQCGSDRVDIAVCNNRRGRLRCLTCNHEAWLDGFTVSDLDRGNFFAGAIVDQARKHRKLSPEEIAKIQSQRVLNRTSW